MEKSKSHSRDRLRNWLLFVGLIFAILAIFFTELDANPNKKQSAKEVMPTTSELQSNSSVVSSAVCKMNTVVAKISKGFTSNS